MKLYLTWLESLTSSTLCLYFKALKDPSSPLLAKIFILYCGSRWHSSRHWESAASGSGFGNPVSCRSLCWNLWRIAGSYLPSWQSKWTDWWGPKWPSGWWYLETIQRGPEPEWKERGILQMLCALGATCLSPSSCSFRLPSPCCLSLYLNMASQYWLRERAASHCYSPKPLFVFRSSAPL